MDKVQFEEDGGETRQTAKNLPSYIAKEKETLPDLKTLEEGHINEETLAELLDKAPKPACNETLMTINDEIPRKEDEILKATDHPRDIVEERFESVPNHEQSKQPENKLQQLILGEYLTITNNLDPGGEHKPLRRNTEVKRHSKSKNKLNNDQSTSGEIRSMEIPINKKRQREQLTITDHQDQGEELDMNIERKKHKHMIGEQWIRNDETTIMYLMEDAPMITPMYTPVKQLFNTLTPYQRATR
ncbi:12097_t:CDS:2 [Acaulospora morrowiae]|uniref:12097_t:CDS:1 n=1 Tax=Acaulospora morrowiae TaxID=94023 RepID=A0A9N9AEU8_9GLOM|nr:12097_t:CDS:2 [Acaulospora morrowiae]